MKDSFRKIFKRSKVLSLTNATTFECPYCMALNDLEIDEVNDIGQSQIVIVKFAVPPIELQHHR